MNKLEAMQQDQLFIHLTTQFPDITFKKSTKSERVLRLYGTKTWQPVCRHGTDIHRCNRKHDESYDQEMEKLNNELIQFQTKFPDYTFRIVETTKNINRLFGTVWKVICNDHANVLKSCVQCRLKPFLTKVLHYLEKCYPSVEYKISESGLNVIRKISGNWYNVCYHNVFKNNCKLEHSEDELDHLYLTSQDPKIKLEILQNNFPEHKFEILTNGSVARIFGKNGKSKFEVCIHNKHFRCKICRPENLCPHMKTYFGCSICGKCPCGKYFSRCVKCGGGSLCACGKNKCKDGYCTVCHPDYVPIGSGISKIGCQFIDILEEELKIKIQHGHYNEEGICDRDEFNIPGTNYHVDGKFVDKTGEMIILEFYGDYYHSHPRMWKKNEEIPIKFKDTEDRMKIIKNLGYKILYIWECEFNDYLDNENGCLYDKLHCFEDKLEF